MAPEPTEAVAETTVDSAGLKMGVMVTEAEEEERRGGGRRAKEGETTGRISTLVDMMHFFYIHICTQKFHLILIIPFPSSNTVAACNTMCVFAGAEKSHVRTGRGRGGH